MNYSTYAAARAYYMSLDATQIKLQLKSKGDTLTWLITYRTGETESFTSPIKD